MCHAFIYNRDGAEPALLQLARVGEQQRVSFNGGELHGGWSWETGETLSVKFSWRAGPPFKTKCFRQANGDMLSIECDGDQAWAVHLHESPRREDWVWPARP